MIVLARFSAAVLLAALGADDGDELAAGSLGALTWFAERPLADAPAAFRDIDAGAEAAAKVLLRP